jgi:hypothetical protein
MKSPESNPEAYTDPTEGSIEVKSESIDTRSISTPLGEIFSSFSSLESEVFERDVLLPEGITQEMIENYPTENEGEGSPLKELQKLLIQYHDSSVSLEEKAEIGKEIANTIKNPE